MKKMTLFLPLCWLLTNNHAFGQYAIENVPPLVPPKSGYEIQNAEGLNSPWLDFAAIPYKDGVVFTSARGGKGIFTCDRDLVSGRYSDLYFAKKDAEGKFFAPELLTGQVNGKYHDGTAVFTSDGDKMIFTRNNHKGQNQAGRIDLKIYMADQKKESWVNTKELPFNSDDFITCHPSLSSDGNILFFASNCPGGYGGMDIYAIKKNKESWGFPVNLGPEVNTPGNEIFPFIADNNELYFASDGHPGLGGLDVFSVLMWGNIPGQRGHLPPPVNTENDDFAFVANEAITSGYLSSNRPGGKGADDIYSWKFSGVRPVNVSICVIEKADGERVDDAKLTIMPAGYSLTDMIEGGNDYSLLQLAPVEIGGKQYFALAAPTAEGVMPGSCGVRLQVMPGSSYFIQVEKEGFEPVKMQVTSADMTVGPEYLIPIEPAKKPVVFSGVVKSAAKKIPLEAATITVLDNCTGEKMELTSDAAGRFDFNLDCRCTYEILAVKENYKPFKKSWGMDNHPCGQEGKSHTIELTPEEEIINVGTVIRLENLYYDYDKYFIRSDAASDLDDIVELMKKYTTMEIELGSHTDARGTDTYNQWLSQKRAEAAVKYIVANGISARRLKARGFGESELVNHCGDGVSCSEEQHQQNRRTEIKITRLDEPGVRAKE